MRYYYDFHIHSGLSPCGDNDMSPNNIVNMALLNELDFIAITDHNTVLNAEVILEIAKATDLVVIPGMELETAEEVHSVCLFPSLDAAKEFNSYVEARLPKIKNRVDIYGKQLIFDVEDEITAEYEFLLLTATTIELSEAIEKVESLGGVLIPAHLDRDSYSLISSFGLIPEDLALNTIEISKAIEPVEFFKKFARSIPKNYSYIRNSDAHYLSDINEKINYFELDHKPTINEIIQMLRDGSLRTYVEGISGICFKGKYA